MHSQVSLCEVRLRAVAPMSSKPGMKAHVGYCKMAREHESYAYLPCLPALGNACCALPLGAWALICWCHRMA